MIFPRETKCFGDCIAVISRKTSKVQFGNKYPKLNYNKEQWLGHRLSYSLNNGIIPRKCQSSDRVWLSEMVLHRCNNKWCVNPIHLYLGSHKENKLDAEMAMTKEQKEARRIKISIANSKPEYRAKMSNIKKGTKHSEEHKRKIGEANKKRWMEKSNSY